MPVAKNRVRLTDRLLRSLRADSARQQLMDDSVPNFGIRVSPTGRKVFFVRYRLGRQNRRQNLGVYPSLQLADAREQARGISVRAARGEDPQRERLEGRRATTFGELAAEYVERHARREKRRWKEDVRILDKDLLPTWRNLAVRDITAADVHRVLDRIVARGARIMANRTRALISRVFNFGVERNVIVHNPVAGVRPPARERSRQIVLSGDEVRGLWAVWTAEGSITAAAFQFLLVTAQREGEILTMRWQDLDGSWWCIPEGVVKNKQAHRVYLTPLALGVLDRLRPRTGDKSWVFASPRKAGTPIVAINKAAERFRDDSGIAGWTPHDLRRTAATYMGRIGVSRFVIGKILNHAETGVTAIYDRSTYEAEMQEALTRWALHLDGILNATHCTPQPCPDALAPEES